MQKPSFLNVLLFLFIFFSINDIMEAQTNKINLKKLYPFNNVEYKFGYMTSDGKVVIKPQFEEVRAFQANGLAAIKINNKWGLINQKGKVVLRPEYAMIWSFAQVLATVQHDEKFGFIDENGKAIIPCKFDNAGSFDAVGMAGTKHGKQWGWIDRQGQFVIKPIYDFAYNFEDRAITTIELNGKYGIINRQGQILVQPEYDEIYPIEGFPLFVSGKEDKYGLINGIGQIIVPSELERLDSEDNLLKDHLLFQKEGKYGFLNKVGKVTIEPVYDQIFPKDPQNYIKVQKGKKYGLLNPAGKLVLPPIYERFWTEYDTTLIAVSKDNLKWGYVDFNGKTVIPPKFVYASNFHNQAYAKAILTGGLRGPYGIINREGTMIVKEQFTDIGYCDDATLIPIAFGDKQHGFIDKTGKIVIDTIYEYAQSFENTEATLVKKEGKYGLINRKGATVLPFIYNGIDRAEGTKLFSIRKDKKHGIANTQGVILIEPTLARGQWLHLEGNFIQYQSGDKYFSFSKTGTYLGDGLKLIHFRKELGYYEIWGLDKKKGLMDEYGTILLTPQFDRLSKEDELIRVTFGKRKGLVSKDFKFLSFTQADIDVELNKK